MEEKKIEEEKKTDQEEVEAAFVTLLEGAPHLLRRSATDAIYGSLRTHPFFWIGMACSFVSHKNLTDIVMLTGVGSICSFLSTLAFPQGSAADFMKQLESRSTIGAVFQVCGTALITTVDNAFASVPYALAARYLFAGERDNSSILFLWAKFFGVNLTLFGVFAAAWFAYTLRVGVNKKGEVTSFSYKGGGVDANVSSTDAK